MLDHHRGELFDGGLWNPSEFFFGFGWVAEEEIDFCGTEVAWVELDMVVEVETDGVEGHLGELADGNRSTSCHDIIVGFWHLEHHPHHLDIVTCESPVALGVEVSEVDLVLHAELDASDCSCDFACDEGFTAAW